MWMITKLLKTFSQNLLRAPHSLCNAPSATQFGRMDEVKAARELVLCCWLPEGYDLEA
jgi:glycine dehydrogenase subunit 2